MDTLGEFGILLSELAAKAQACDVSDDEMRALVGAWPLPAQPCRNHETRARRLFEVLRLARWLLFDDAAEWLRAPHPAFQGRSPIWVMRTQPGMIAALRDRLRLEIDAA
ncbi:MbcA/ParS/Xre antitoxin family protein [Citromicrobium bathyomarinum]